VKFQAGREKLADFEKSGRHEKPADFEKSGGHEKTCGS
jgi:hypothetical protein